METSTIKLTDKQNDALRGAFGKPVAAAMREIVRYAGSTGAGGLADATYQGFYIGTPDSAYGFNEALEFTRSLIGMGADVKGFLIAAPDTHGLKRSERKDYIRMLNELGLNNENDLSCDISGTSSRLNPGTGDVLSWSFSGSSVYANSVIGARCPDMPPMIALCGAVTGYVPCDPLLTEDGRLARCVIRMGSDVAPDPNLLGSYIGSAAAGLIPYIYGLDTLLAPFSKAEKNAFLKDFCHALAVAEILMFHADGLTPEAIAATDALIVSGSPEYDVDENVLTEYADTLPAPKTDDKARLCLIGCPHLSYSQLVDLTNEVVYDLRIKNRNRVAVRTSVFASPTTVREFMGSMKYLEFSSAGMKLKTGCPFDHSKDAGTKNHCKIITSSERLRSCGGAEYHTPEELADIITGKARKF